MFGRNTMPLLSLPPEVRQEIYRACVSTSTFSTLHEVLPLNLVSKALRADTIPIFDNHGLPFPTINQLYAFLLAIKRPRRTALRCLTFCYAPRSGPAGGQVKWEDIELAGRAFKLLNRQCRALVRLTAIVDEQDTRRHFNLGWNDTWRSDEERETKCDVVTTCGIHELAKVRDVKEVRFVPVEGTVFTEYAQAVFREFEGNMMSPRDAGKHKRRSHSMAVPG